MPSVCFPLQTDYSHPAEVSTTSEQAQTGELGQPPLHVNSPNTQSQMQSAHMRLTQTGILHVHLCCAYPPLRASSHHKIKGKVIIRYGAKRFICQP